MVNRANGKILSTLVAVSAVIATTVIGLSFYFSSSTIYSLLSANRKLSEAIKNLTAEEQIGFATVVSQEKDPLGNTTTLLKFVQTAPGNPKEIVNEKIYTIEGEVVHFDALIIKFSDDYVKDGTKRALYLWRRIYGEHTTPGQAQVIEESQSAPERYDSITRALKVRDRTVFWEAIWALANDPHNLSTHGINAVFGNAIYTKVEPNKVYLFKISTTGQIYPEVMNFSTGEVSNP